RFDQIGASRKRDRHWRAARIAQLFLTAARTLRSGSHAMLGNCRPQEIETENVIAQIGAKVAGNSFGNLKRRELDPGLSEGSVGERRNYNAARLFALEHRLDFAVSFHAIGEAGPAATLARSEHRTHQRENAGRLNEQPGRMVGQMLAVQFREPP